MLGLKKRRIFCFHKDRFEIDQTLSFNKKSVTKIDFTVESLGRSLRSVKRYFQMHKQRLSFARPQNTQIFLLLLGDIKVQIKKCTKVFSAAPVKCLFSLEFIWLSISSFWFSKNQRSQFHHNTFSKIYSAMEGLGICLPYIKKCFQEHQWSACLFMAQITQILLFLGMLLLERLKITVCERNFFFLSGFSFPNIHEPQDCRGRGRAFL